MPSRHRLAAGALPAFLRASAPVPPTASLTASLAKTACCSVAARTIASTSASASASPRNTLCLRNQALATTGTRNYRLVVLRRAYSSAPPLVSKIWSFEEVQTATKDPDNKAVIVDAREPGELAATGHIPGAINIPVTSSPDGFFLSDEDFEDRFGFERPARDAELVFYCKAGVRSRAAAGLARDAGWTNVSEYRGSWQDWAGRGGAIEH